MQPLISVFVDGVRIVFLRAPRNIALSRGTGPFIALVAMYFAVSLGMDVIDGSHGSLDPAGVTTLLADSLLTLITAWLLVNLADRPEAVWGAASILLSATIVGAVLIHWPLQHLTDLLLNHGQILLASLTGVLASLWWFVILLAFAHWLAPRSLGRVLMAAVVAYAVSAAAWWWLPATPLLQPATSADAADNAVAPPPTADDADSQPARTEDQDTEAPDFSPEGVMFDQSALLDAALAQLRPQTPGKPDLYVVAFAGDAQERVFGNEAQYVEQLFSQRFGAAGRVLILENNAATVKTRPLATWTNLHHALEAIATKMDPAEDILLIYVATHGSEDHQLLVDLDPLPLDQIEPDDLADALKTTPRIRWKVIIINACYSGGFIDAVRDDSTMVMTSARADRTSFGCGADADITYFGKAFLTQALNQTTSLREAFDLAARTVADWETADKEEHSEPQIASTPSIEAKLESWRRGLAPAPAVPFAPAANPR